MLMRRIFLTQLLLLFIFLIPFKIFCQDKKDTIYFDEGWSICEKPVAEYYRVCSLNKDKEIFYKGDVEDYYLNGQLEMTGHYNDKGVKEGDFIFYTENGDTLIKGTYLHNQMFGQWLFYNLIGKLTTEINCKNEYDFTPLLIINENGDTILKSGNGKFVFDMQKQLPKFFYGKKNYIIEGEVKNSLKDGTYSCYIASPKKQLLFSQEYKNGKLKPTIYTNSATEFMNVADYKYSLAPPNLVKIDQFNHTNFVFEYNYDAESELINFLINNETPFIKSRATNVQENDDLLFDIIANVLYNSLMNSNKTKDIYYKKFKYPVKTYYTAAYSKNERNTFPKINADIVLTIDTTGYIVNSVFSSNLTKQQINKISYYFTHILNLSPYYIEDEKTMHNLNLKLDMLIDTLKNDSFHVSYIMYNSDSVNKKDLANYIFKGNDSTIQKEAKLPTEDYYKEFTSVQIEAKFPGGMDGWNKFLQRNLNSQIPADHGAPRGDYTVTVSFLVDEEGNISEVQALNNPGYGTAEEAVRVIKNGPKWIPAIQDGKNVKYRQKQNITFQVSSQ